MSDEIECIDSLVDSGEVEEPASKAEKEKHKEYVHNLMRSPNDYICGLGIHAGLVAAVFLHPLIGFTILASATAQVICKEYLRNPELKIEQLNYDLYFRDRESN